MPSISFANARLLSQVAYCSTACRDKDEFHYEGSPECGLAWPRMLPEEALLAVR